MKFLKISIVLLFLIALVSCGPNGNRHDILPGTPTKADTVLPKKFNNSNEHQMHEESNDKLPSEIKR